MNVYAVKDVTSQRFISISLAESDDTFVRASLYALLLDYPIKDIEFYCVGQFDCELGVIKPCVPRLGNWECYKFPTTTMDREKFLTIEQLEQMAKNKKHEFLVEQKNQIPHLEKLLSEAKGKLNLEESKKVNKDKTKIRNLKKSVKELSHSLSELKSIKE